jgi:adenine phosphoribosyltransferase
VDENMNDLTIDDLKQLIAEVPDFPKPGIVFRDISPVLAHPAGIRSVADHFRGMLQNRDIDCDVIAGIESRGFIFGTALAYALNVGFVPIRKQGKLPRKSYAQSFDLEYGQDTVEIHQDAIRPDQNVLIVDDLLATGGTAQASIDLITQFSARELTSDGSNYFII